MDPLEVVSRGNEIHRVLGRGATPLVKLVATPNLPGVDHSQAGLFHTAFLFENQASLAATVAHAAQNTNSRVVGSSDHLVSEAFYFTDPEGNGIELYVDPNAFLAEHLDGETLAQANTLPGTIGHVHLQVGDVPTARRFYVEALGFEPTLASMPGLLFASAGGYHHHVTMKT